MTAQLMWKLLEPMLLLLLAIPMLALALLFMRGYPIHLILWNVLAGWAYVVVRSVTEAEANLAGIATGAVCVIAIIGIMHYLAAWLYREVRIKQERTDWPTAWRWRWTLAL